MKQSITVIILLLGALVINTDASAGTNDIKGLNGITVNNNTGTAETTRSCVGQDCGKANAFSGKWKNPDSSSVVQIKTFPKCASTSMAANTAMDVDQEVNDFIINTSKIIVRDVKSSTVGGSSTPGSSSMYCITQTLIYSIGNF